MSIFDIFKNKNGRYISENEHLKNLSNQLRMSPQTVDQLRGLGVGEDNNLKLEFFFYTNTIEKAESLSNELTKLGYQSEFGHSAGSKYKIVTGWTIPISMSLKSVLDWTKTMCEMGFKHDCEFDGWGTNPNQ